MGEIVVYKLGEFKGQASSSIVDEHYYHATNPKHQGRVLFTVPSQPNTTIGKNRHLSQIIVTTANGSHAFIGSLEAGGYGTFPDKPDSAYTSPSQFDVEQEAREGYTWFAIDNLERLSSEALNTYTNSTTHKPLLISLSGASCRIYVD